MVDIRTTRSRRLRMDTRLRLHTDTHGHRHTGMRGHRHTGTCRRREWAITTRIISGTTVTGGFRTITPGCINIIRTGLRRKSRPITTIINSRFRTLASRESPRQHAVKILVVTYRELERSRNASAPLRSYGAEGPRPADF